VNKDEYILNLADKQMIRCVRCCRVMSGAVELQSVERQSLQPAPAISQIDIGASPVIRHVDVMTRDVMTRDPDNDEDYDHFDCDAVTSQHHASASYLRQARASICKMTVDYIRRLPSSRARKDRSATRRERKATKTLAIVLGQCRVS